MDGFPKTDELVPGTRGGKRRVKSLNNNSSMVHMDDHLSPDSSKVLSFDAYGNLTDSNDPKTVYSQSVPSLEEFNLILDSFEGTPTKNKQKEGGNKPKCGRSIKSPAGKQDTSLSETELKQVFKSDISMLATSRYGRTRKQRSAEGFLFGTINFKELNKVTSCRKSSSGEEQASEMMGNGTVEPNAIHELVPAINDSFEISDLEIEEQQVPMLRKRKSSIDKDKVDQCNKKKKISLPKKRKRPTDDKSPRKHRRKQSTEIPVSASLEEDLLIINKHIDEPAKDSKSAALELIPAVIPKEEFIDKKEKLFPIFESVKKVGIKSTPVEDTSTEIKEEPIKAVEISALEKKINEGEEDCDLCHSLADLVWVYIKGNPLWPALVSCPEEMDIFTKLSTTHYKKPVRLYHVLFLNDGGRTLWVNPKNMVVFDGKEKLRKFLEDIKEMEKLKKVNWQASNPMLKTLLILQKNDGHKYVRWQEAIRKAEELALIEKSIRVACFEDEKDTVVKKPPKLKPHKVKKTKKLEKKIKSSPKILPLRPPPKKEETILEDSDSEAEFLGFDDTLINEGKIKQKKLKEKVLDGFDVYLDKHLQSYMDQHKHVSMPKEKAIKVLYNLWKRLTFLQKNRYRQQSGSKVNDFVLDTDYSSDSSGSYNAYGSRKVSTKGTYKIPRHEKVCHKCNGRREKDGSPILRCKGVCSATFHLSCLDLTVAPEGDFKCVSCLSGVHCCFICKSSENKVVKCTVPHCGKFYHFECARKWPQVSKSKYNEKLTCPRHMCHMCSANADDMNDLAAKTPPFTKCLLCPTTYHTGDTCIAAGVEEVTHQYHICTKHLDFPKANNFHCNVNWCFCCSKGGSLLLCDQCPAAFHAECLNITAPDGDYVCGDCENGKFPIYGDVVWVKLGSYRWWPGQVQHPKYIPDNIENLSHKQGMFCVHFFGSDDYFWVSRGRVFLYQEGDQGSKASSSRPIEQQFRKAMAEAVSAYRDQKKRRDEQEATRSLKGNKKPPPYVRIETNRPVGNVRLGKLDLASVTKCECDPFSPNPCSSDEKCLNRMLLVECVPQVCASGDRCGNQRFQKRQYPSIQPFRTSARGWGLKTNEFIQKGQFIIEYVGELVDEPELKRRVVEMQDQNEENYYFLTIDKDHIIDAGPKGNLSRFMNHSCQPNCETQKWTVGADTRVGLFALDDVVEGSELIFNYNLECIGTDKKKCHCGAPQCSGFIGAKVQKEKYTKTDSSKKKKKKKKKDKKDTEDECFRCGGPGDLVLCDLVTCPKAYHLDCLHLKTLPKGKWICPWHHCDECGSRAINRCVCCPNSYCRPHSKDQFIDDEHKICLDHDHDEIEQALGPSEVTFRPFVEMPEKSDHVSGVVSDKLATDSATKAITGEKLAAQSSTATAIIPTGAVTISGKVTSNDGGNGNRDWEMSTEISPPRKKLKMDSGTWSENFTPKMRDMSAGELFQSDILDNTISNCESVIKEVTPREVLDHTALATGRRRTRRTTTFLGDIPAKKEYYSSTSISAKDISSSQQSSNEVFTSREELIKDTKISENVDETHDGRSEKLVKKIIPDCESITKETISGEALKTPDTSSLRDTENMATSIGDLSVTEEYPSSTSIYAECIASRKQLNNEVFSSSEELSTVTTRTSEKLDKDLNVRSEKLDKIDISNSESITKEASSCVAQKEPAISTRRITKNLANTSMCDLPINKEYPSSNSISIDDIPSSEPLNNEMFRGTEELSKVTTRTSEKLDNKRNARSEKLITMDIPNSESITKEPSPCVAQKEPVSSTRRITRNLANTSMCELPVNEEYPSGNSISVDSSSSEPLRNEIFGSSAELTEVITTSEELHKDSARSKRSDRKRSARSKRSDRKRSARSKRSDRKRSARSKKCNNKIRKLDKKIIPNCELITKKATSREASKEPVVRNLRTIKQITTSITDIPVMKKYNSSNNIPVEDISLSVPLNNEMLFSSSEDLSKVTTRTSEKLDKDRNARSEILDKIDIQNCESITKEATSCEVHQEPATSNRRLTRNLTNISTFDLPVNKEYPSSNSISVKDISPSEPLNNEVISLSEELTTVTTTASEVLDRRRSSRSTKSNKRHNSGSEVSMKRNAFSKKLDKKYNGYELNTKETTSSELFSAKATATCSRRMTRKLAAISMDNMPEECPSSSRISADDASSNEHITNGILSASEELIKDATGTTAREELGKKSNAISEQLVKKRNTRKEESVTEDATGGFVPRTTSATSKQKTTSKIALYKGDTSIKQKQLSVEEDSFIDPLNNKIFSASEEVSKVTSEKLDKNPNGRSGNLLKKRNAGSKKLDKSRNTRCRKSVQKLNARSKRFNRKPTFINKLYANDSTPCVQLRTNEGAAKAVNRSAACSQSNNTSAVGNSVTNCNTNADAKEDSGTPQFRLDRDISSVRSALIVDIEYMLLGWIEANKCNNYTPTDRDIQKKARLWHKKLVRENGQRALFVASNGWLNRFKKRCLLLKNQSVTKEPVRPPGKTTRTLLDTITTSPDQLGRLVNEGEYTQQQVYTVYETKLFWKKMPASIFKTESKTSTYKTPRDCITVILASNVAADHKLEPFLVDHSKSCRDADSYSKTASGLAWCCNRAMVLTENVVALWLTKHFIPAVQQHSARQNIANRALLVLKDVPIQLAKLNALSDNIRVEVIWSKASISHSPPISARIKALYFRRTLQHLCESVVDQLDKCGMAEYWNSFNLSNCADIIVDAWRQVNEGSIREHWKNTLTACFDDGSDGCKREETLERIVGEIVDLSGSLGCMEVDGNSVSEAIGLRVPISLENFKAESSPSRLQTASEAFRLIEEGLRVLSKHDPHRHRSLRASRHIKAAGFRYRQRWRARRLDSPVDMILNNSSKEAAAPRDDKLLVIE